MRTLSAVIVAMLATGAQAEPRPGVGEIGHLIDDGKPIVACVTKDGFARSGAGCSGTLPDGTVKVIDTDGSRGHVRVCWPNGFRVWVNGDRTAAGPDPVPPDNLMRRRHAADLQEFGWSKCTP